MQDMKGCRTQYRVGGSERSLRGVDKVAKLDRRAAFKRKTSFANRRSEAIWST